MSDNAKNVIFEVQNVAIYALFWGKFLKLGKCACVKNLTNMMSAKNGDHFYRPKYPPK